MSLFLRVNTSWCPADLGRRQSVSRRHESPRPGGARGPPPRAPPLFPECMDPDGNRMGADSCVPVGPAAASGPGFHIRWPPSGPRVSARAIPVSVDGRGPPADARVPRFTMNFFFFMSAYCFPEVRSPCSTGFWFPKSLESWLRLFLVYCNTKEKPLQTSGFPINLCFNYLSYIIGLTV